VRALCLAVTPYLSVSLPKHHETNSRVRGESLMMAVVSSQSEACENLNRGDAVTRIGRWRTIECYKRPNSNTHCRLLVPRASLVLCTVTTTLGFHLPWIWFRSLYLCGFTAEIRQGLKPAYIQTNLAHRPIRVSASSWSFNIVPTASLRIQCLTNLASGGSRYVYYGFEMN
jgi:hypothetical protein